MINKLPIYLIFPLLNTYDVNCSWGKVGYPVAGYKFRLPSVCTALCWKHFIAKCYDHGIDPMNLYVTRILPVSYNNIYIELEV